MTGCFRVILLVSLSLFWGGLTFYTGFVVRVIHDVLNDPMDGGLITQRVTHILQILGAVACVFMIQNCFVVIKQFRRYAAKKQSRRYEAVLVICTFLFACSLIGLHLVHGQLDAVIDRPNHEVIDREAFVEGHRRYNQLTTVQWLSSSAYLMATVVAWMKVDSQADQD